MYICTAISKYILEQFVVYDLLEPDALQGASPVLRGRDYSDIVLLPDHGDAYHSKYNLIERCWAALENYWNGAILDSVEAAAHWAANMTLKGIAPIVHLVETTYEKGIKVLSRELEQYQPQWQRSETLPKWDITIVPV